MAFNNIFDSSLIDYSKDFEEHDNTYLEEKKFILDFFNKKLKVFRGDVASAPIISGPESYPYKIKTSISNNTLIFNLDNRPEYFCYNGDTVKEAVEYWKTIPFPDEYFLYFIRNSISSKYSIENIEYLLRKFNIKSAQLHLVGPMYEEDEDLGENPIIDVDVTRLKLPYSGADTAYTRLMTNLLCGKFK